MARSGWMTDRYKRDGEIPMVDMPLLLAIEKNPEAYFANSGHHVRRFLVIWGLICENNLAITEGVTGVEDYINDQVATLARIMALQEKQGEKK